MKRGGRLRRVPPLRSYQQLRPVSQKRRGEQNGRAEVRAVTAARAGGCCQLADIVPEVACWGPLDTDEKVSRGVRPGAHLEQAVTQLACRAHHDWRGANPAEAHRRGVRWLSWEVPVVDSKVTPRPEQREAS